VHAAILAELADVRATVERLNKMDKMRKEKEALQAQLGLRARPPPSSRLHAAAPLAHQPARAAPMTIGRRSRGTRVVG